MFLVDAIMRYYLRITTAILCLIWLFPSMANSNLYEPISKAKSRETIYMQKFGAVAPLFKTNSEGLIIWECWASPPEEWTKKQAMEFAKLLIPKKLLKEKPKKGDKDSSYEPYMYSDGTMIILTSGINNKYIGVEVRAPGYKGPRC